MTLSGTNLAHAHSYNRRVVLEAARLHGRISRAEIARLTALTPQTVSNITQDLIRMGLLRAAGRRRAAAGQPPVELEIVPDGGFTLGLQLDHNALIGTLVNLSGARLGDVAMPIATPTPARALPRMVGMVADLVSRTQVPMKRIWGIGVVMPGPFDVEDLSSTGATTLPGWSGFPLAERLGAAVGARVLIENDATAAAIGEKLYGAARRFRDFVYLYIGTGLGGGLFLDGQPYKGHWGNAGELGHLVVDPDGPACFCGNAGCLERYLSLDAAYAWCRAAGLDVASPAALEAAYRDGAAAPRAWLDEAAAQLRRGLNILENLLDPETVVVGGQLPDALIAALLARLPSLAPSVSQRRQRTVPRLIAATAGPHSAALGAAALPIFDTMSPCLAVLHKKRAAPRSGGFVARGDQP
jgi:predicted NBD/HSP70 family sugar kinase